MRKQGRRGSLHINPWQLALIIYICFIYANSLTPAHVSSRESGFVLSQIRSLLEMASLDGSWLTEHIVRKTAHFAEYTGLGALLVLSFQTWLAPAAARLRTACELAFVLPLVDETIQLFVPGRSGQVDDVWLDIMGVFFGLVIMNVIMKAAGKRRSMALGKELQVKGE